MLSKRFKTALLAAMAALMLLPGAAFARDVRFLNRPGRGKRTRQKKPPISFNEHD